MNEKLVDAWVNALKRYRDSEIANAGHKAMAECLKMPTPMDVIARIPVGEKMENEKFAMTSAKCKQCGRTALCISEPIGSPYICRECYTGLTSAQIEERFKDLGLMMGNKDYIPDWVRDLNGKEI